MAVNCKILNTPQCQENNACYVNKLTNGTLECKCSTSYVDVDNTSQICARCGAYFIPNTNASIYECTNIPLSRYGFYGVTTYTEEECKSIGGSVNKRKRLCTCGSKKVVFDKKCFNKDFLKPINCSALNNKQYECNQNLQCAYQSTTNNGTCICNTTRGFYNNGGICEQCPIGEYYSATAKKCQNLSTGNVASVTKVGEVTVADCINMGMIIQGRQCKCPASKMAEGNITCQAALEVLPLSLSSGPQDAFGLGVSGLFFSIIAAALIALILVVILLGCMAKRDPSKKKEKGKKKEEPKVPPTQPLEAVNSVGEKEAVGAINAPAQLQGP